MNVPYLWLQLKRIVYLNVTILTGQSQPICMYVKLGPVMVRTDATMRRSTGSPPTTKPWNPLYFALYLVCHYGRCNRLFEKV